MEDAGSIMSRQKDKKFSMEDAGLKIQDRKIMGWKMHDQKMQDKKCGVEKAGLGDAAPEKCMTWNTNLTDTSYC